MRAIREIEDDIDKAERKLRDFDFDVDTMLLGADPTMSFQRKELVDDIEVLKKELVETEKAYAKWGCL